MKRIISFIVVSIITSIPPLKDKFSILKFFFETVIDISELTFNFIIQS